MVWLPDNEKKLEDTFIRFDRIHERDRLADGRTPHDGIGRALCITSRGRQSILSQILFTSLVTVVRTQFHDFIHPFGPCDLNL